MQNIWIFYIVIFAFLKGSRECIKKAALKKSGANEILFFYTLIGFILTIPYSATAFKLDKIYIFYAFIKSLCCCIAWIFSLYALNKMSVSLYGVMDMSRMFFSTALAIIVLGEAFTLSKAVGMVLVVAGLMLVNLKKTSTKRPVTLGTLFAVLLSCFLNAISGTLDKILLKTVAPTQLQFWFMFFLSVNYGLILFIKKEKISFKTLKTNLWIPLMSLSLVLGDLFLFMANAVPESQVTLMTLIKQSAVIVSILSGWIFFKEKNILYKLLCTLIIITGIVIPLVFK